MQSNREAGCLDFGGHMKNIEVKEGQRVQGGEHADQQ